MTLLLFRKEFCCLFFLVCAIQIMIIVNCFILFNGFAFSLQTFSRWELMGIPKKFIVVSSQGNLNISCTAFEYLLFIPSAITLDLI